jgi:hypothetical protein
MHSRSSGTTQKVYEKKQAGIHAQHRRLAPFLTPDRDAAAAMITTGVPTSSSDPLPYLQSTGQSLCTTSTSLPHLLRGEGAAAPARPPSSLTRPLPTARGPQHAYGERLLRYQRLRLGEHDAPGRWHGRRCNRMGRTPA